jgi:hypothetical protein
VTKNRFPSQPAARKRRMLFDDLAEAGELLARALTKWRGSPRLVVAIPRGTVLMAKIVAERLDVDDRLATGATMVTTLHPMRAKNAKRQIGVNVTMARAMRSSRTSGRGCPARNGTPHRRNVEPAPTLRGVSEAPMTATDRGRNRCSRFRMLIVDLRCDHQNRSTKRLLLTFVRRGQADSNARSGSGRCHRLQTAGLRRALL